MKRIILVSVLTTLTIALSGCTGGKAGGETSSPVQTAESGITIGIPQDLEDSLDPHKAVAAGTKEVLFNVYEGLMKPDSDGNLYPAIAEDYSVSEDGLTYTFTLRDVSFHDGSKVTAEDVKYSIERLAAAEDGAIQVAAFSDITGVEIPDEKTVVITLVKKNADFLFYLTSAVLPKANADKDNKPIGTGPYMYVSRSPQENLKFKAFDGYWGEKPQIQDVTFKICANTDSIVMELKGGSVDVFPRVTAAQAAQLGDDFNIEEGTMNLVQAVYLNHDTPVFQDVRVRQALCYALDRQQILDFMAEGKGVIIGSSMFPAFGKYYLPELAKRYPQDLEKAKSLLAEAGYPDGFSFTIKVPSNYGPHIDTAQVVAEQLKQINVTANIELIEWDSWLSDVYSDRKYEATVVGVDASSLTASALLSRFTSSAKNNFINYKNDAYDKAYEMAENEQDPDKQTGYYQECEKILAEDAANVYIQDMAEFVAVRKKYTGYEFYPLYVQDISKLKLAE